MNAEQYYRHLILIENDSLIIRLRSEIKKCKKPSEKSKLVFQIYNRSIELKEKVISESQDLANLSEIEHLNFGKAIDEYLSRKE